MSKKIRFRLNSQEVTVETDPGKRLVDMLRDDLELTGTKQGCGIGECGACTVVLNSKAVNSCLVLAGQVEGGDLLTVEGLEKNGELHPLQSQFLEKGAVQCGFCSPGMLLSAYALLEKKPDVTRGEIKEAIAGNLCRCTGHEQIIQAITACCDDTQT